jgi:predicted nuclease of predicted toxin-antitoxin system
MTERIRFHLDENVASAVANGLRLRGVVVTTPGDVGLLEAPDQEHLQFAMQHGCVIFTHDDDYLALAKEMPHAEIIYSQLQKRTVGQILAALLLIWDCLTPEDMRNHIEFI